MMSKREFKVKIDGVEQGYFVREPSPKIKRKAEEYKATVFKTEAFRKDITGKNTSIFADEVYNLMREKGMWSDADEAELRSVSEAIEHKIALLSKGKTKEVDTVAKLREIVIKDIKELRAKQFKLLSKSNKFHELTVEAISDKAESEYLATFCTFTEDDNLAFESLDAFKEADPVLKETAIQELNILTGVSNPNWALELPENKILIKHKLLDSEGRYILNGVKVNSDGKPVNDKGFLINEKGEAVDEDGNLIDDNGEILGYTDFDEEVEVVKTP